MHMAIVTFPSGGGSRRVRNPDPGEHQGRSDVYMCVLLYIVTRSPRGETRRAELDPTWLLRVSESLASCVGRRRGQPAIT